MKKKYEFNKETQFFCIDPAHLAEGLKAAKGEHTAICVKALDLRSKNLAFDMAALAACGWITRLEIHPDIPIPAKDIAQLESLTGLEDLSLKEQGPLSYASFPKLRTLTLTAGTALDGLDTLPSLSSLYLPLWKADALPKTIGAISATAVRISASRKLASIAPLCEAPALRSLMLQDLPALQVGKEINHLKTLQELHVEKCGWTDLSNLKLDGLHKLFASTLQSLAFIAQLKQLQDLFFWDCVDGDLSPVLKHPALKSVRFFPAKKHYSHKLPDLQAALAARAAK